MDIQTIVKSLSQKRPVFHNEADFQHALAWEIREHYPESKIRLETKVHGENTKVYLDIIVYFQGKKYAIELKYKTRKFECVVEGEGFSLNSHGAHDVGRYDVLKDIQRLEQMVEAEVADEGILICLTNDPSYYSDPGVEKNTADREFRLHEGRKLEGKLSWGEQTGPGTMTGRENSIHLQYQYVMRWHSYSYIEGAKKGDFRYLMLSVQEVRSETKNAQSPSPVLNVITTAQNAPLLSANLFHQNSEDAETWFDSFSQRQEIPLSQVDLRDKLSTHLRHLGYSVQLNRELRKEKYDIWAQKDQEIIIIEVRYKTAFLQTIYQDRHFHLKNQAAQDISRYDFLNDLEKVEKVVHARQDVKGYALLLTNDRLYWQAPKKQNSVDEAFHIHQGHMVNGFCSWKEEASKGTTSGREKSIQIIGKYQMNWRPYLTLGANKNELFQVLVVEVKH